MKKPINQEFLRQFLLLFAGGLIGLIIGFVFVLPQSGGLLRSANEDMIIRQLNPTELRAFIGQTYKLDDAALNGGVVASRNGEVYYYPSCSGWGRIKEENRIWFLSSEEAEQEGYRIAKSCQ